MTGSPETFIIDTTQISNTKDGDDYYIEFDATELRLMSAEIMNVETDKSIHINTTYTDAEFINATQTGEKLSWGTREQQISSARTINLTSNSLSNGNLSITPSNMSYVDSTHGYIHDGSKEEASLTIYSDTNSALNLIVEENEHTITFYTDNIGTDNDVHKDSLSGEKITIGEKYPQSVTGTQTFVFSDTVLEINPHP